MRFLSIKPTPEDHWRAILLFGANTASYKFALGQVLLENAKKSKLRLQEIALPFAEAILQNQRRYKKQSTSSSSRFLKAVHDYGEGKILKDEIIAITLSDGFRYVLDAFHKVNGTETIRFFDVSKDKKTLSLTDSLGGLSSKNNIPILLGELDSRWNLVAAAWNLGISANLIGPVEFSNSDESLLFRASATQRVNVTSCRGALNGYQKGRCFYCFCRISIISGHRNMCEVDHFIPFALMKTVPNWRIDLNGVWNLVLACDSCNQKKRERIPHIAYLERLNIRNNFLISSHHPLQETLMNQTGSSEESRRKFLQSAYNSALKNLIHTWSAESEEEACF